MGKKYIIDLNPDCVEGEYLRIPARIAGEEQWLVTKAALTPYTEPDLEQVRKEAYENGYENGFIAGHLKAEKSGQSFYEDGYQRGLNDAWEAARTLWNTPTRKEIFGYTTFSTTIMTLTAQEALEKIRQYEQEKEEQITKGDIVLMKSTPEVEILVTYADEEYVSGIALTEVDDNCEIGDQYTNIRISNVENTGKHYDIVSVLQKMKEE